MPNENGYASQTPSGDANTPSPVNGGYAQNAYETSQQAGRFYQGQPIYHQPVDAAIGQQPVMPSADGPYASCQAGMGQAGPYSAGMGQAGLYPAGMGQPGPYPAGMGQVAPSSIDTGQGGLAESNAHSFQGGVQGPVPAQGGMQSAVQKTAQQAQASNSEPDAAGEGKTAKAASRSAAPEPPRSVEAATAQNFAGFQSPNGQMPFQPAFAQDGSGPYYIPVMMQTEQKKKSKKWIIPLVVLLCLLIALAFSVKSCSDSLSKVSGSSSSYTPGSLTSDAVGVITMDGTIQYDGTACSPEGFKELLDKAAADEHIKALVIRVNSGGGTATAGEEMTEYLKDFDKPVVVSSASINASAAYMISSQSDYIYVAQSTEIGAIGVAMQLTNLAGLLDKLGISMDVITSSDSKDSSYGYRELTDEERAYYQDMVDQINDMFVSQVMEGRNMSEADARKLANGMPYTGNDAVKNGLADEVGTLGDALDKAAELAGISSYKAVNIDFKNYDISSLTGLFGESSTSINDVLGILKEAGYASAK